MKFKAFFITFKGLSMKQIAQIFLECESPTLTHILGVGAFAPYCYFSHIQGLLPKSPKFSSSWTLFVYGS